MFESTRCSHAVFSVPRTRVLCAAVLCYADATRRKMKVKVKVKKKVKRQKENEKIIKEKVNKKEYNKSAGVFFFACLGFTARVSPDAAAICPEAEERFRVTRLRQHTCRSLSLCADVFACAGAPVFFWH